MDEHVYKKIELTGSSATSIEDAVQKALAKAAQSIHNMRWFEIVETRGAVDGGGKILEWQVTLKLGFTVD